MRPGPWHAGARPRHNEAPKTPTPAMQHPPATAMDGLEPHSPMVWRHNGGCGCMASASRAHCGCRAASTLLTTLLQAMGLLQPGDVQLRQVLYASGGRAKLTRHWEPVDAWSWPRSETRDRGGSLTRCWGPRCERARCLFRAELLCFLLALGNAICGPSSGCSMSQQAHKEQGGNARSYLARVSVKVQYCAV